MLSDHSVAAQILIHALKVHAVVATETLYASSQHHLGYTLWEWPSYPFGSVVSLHDSRPPIEPVYRLLERDSSELQFDTRLSRCILEKQ